MKMTFNSSVIWRSLPAAFPFAFLLMLLLPVEYLTDGAQESWGIRGNFAIPSRNQLHTLSGVIIPSSEISACGVLRHGSCFTWEIGNILSSDNKLLSFSCRPGGDNLECVGDGYQSYVGKVVEARYLNFPDWLYPEYDYSTTGAGPTIRISRRAANVVMELTEVSDGRRVPILTYSESAKKLASYRREHPRFSISLIDIGMISLMAICFGAALVGQSRREWIRQSKIAPNASMIT